MPAEICKIIICGSERSRAVANDADLILDDETTRLTKAQHATVEGIRDSALALAQSFDFMEEAGLAEGVTLETVEKLFTGFEKDARTLLVEVLDGAAA